MMIMENAVIYRKQAPTLELVKIKHRGKIFTPDYLVEDILDQGHYTQGRIRCKHVMDNSCGDGQFLIHVVNRYCQDFLSENQDRCLLKKELETYIHAIEIEEAELLICKQRCEKVANQYGIQDVKWDFVNGDSLKIPDFNGKMDFVVGNPPYVRVHNLNDDFAAVKGFLFGNGGMTDLFIVFYEIGIRMLSETGILAYITPSSFFTSVAGANIRRYLLEHNLLESVCDLKHFQPFNATTYTTIICLNKSRTNNTVDYYEFDSRNLIPYYVETLSANDYLINGNFYFSKKDNLDLLGRISRNIAHADVSVKNGYATLADKVFIHDFDFQSSHIIPIVKASRGQWTYAFYPYDKQSNLISLDELMQDKPMYEHLLTYQAVLLKRSNEKDPETYWYAFGRSQGINDTFRDKIAINALIRTSKDLKITDVPAGSGVYSGLYIISDTIPAEKIKAALMDEEFGEYVALLGKYKSGGYYTFSSKDVKFYLDYKLNQNGVLSC